MPRQSFSTASTQHGIAVTPGGSESSQASTSTTSSKVLVSYIRDEREKAGKHGP